MSAEILHARISGRSSLHASTNFADSFEGVEVTADEPDDVRLSYVNFFVETFHLLEKTGWFDHTSDWDFHVGIRLRDGREEAHFGDGTTLAIVERLAMNEHRQLDDAAVGSLELASGKDLALFVEAPGFFVFDGEEAELSHAFDEFAVSGPEPQTNECVWLIPVRQIEKLTFGFCT